MPITTLVNNSVDTSVERDTRLTGLASIAVTRDIRSTGQLTTNVVRDARLSASVSPIAYSGPFVSVGDTTSSNSFGFNVPFVNAGSHVILAITHASGGNVTGATDTRGNTWTVDQPSTYTSTTGIAVVSAPILNSIQANDTITITWSAPVTHKAVVGEVFRGLLQATYVDRTASNTGTGYLIDTGTTAQTNFSKELVFGAFAVPGSADVDFAPDVGFTEIGEANSDFGNGANRTVTGAFKIVQAQGAYNVTGSLSPPIATSVIRDIRTIGSAGNNLANLWIDPNGGSGTRSSTPVAYNDATACGSFEAAYAAAQSGDTIGVTGTLGIQKFAGGYQSNQGPGSKTLTFFGVPGNKIRQIHFGSPNLTFDGLNVDADAIVTTGAVFENGGLPFTFKNGSIGNVTDEKGALVTGAGIVFDNVLIHDVFIETPGVHNEGIWAGVPEGMIIRNCTFERCATMDIFFTFPDYWVPMPDPYGNVTLENNWFGVPRGLGSPGSPLGYSIYIAKNGPSLEDQTPMSGWRIRNNYFEPGSYGVNNDQPLGSNNIFCGNTGNVDSSWQVACA